MPVKLLRQFLALLIATAYIGATTLQVAPMAYAASTDTIGGSMYEQDSPGDKMPCTGMVPGCITELGCIFLLSLPAAPEFRVFTRTAWLLVVYSGSSRSLHGRTIKPAVGPPISLA